VTVYKYCHVCKAVKLSPSNNATTCIDCLESGIKWCSQCGVVKNLNLFERRRDKIGSSCKACKNAKQRERYQTEDAFREKLKASNRNYANNRYATDSEFRAAEQVRKQIRRAAGTLTINEWFNTVEYFQYTCAYCGSPHSLTMDHIVPICKGGKTTPDNIIPACSSCNSSKQAEDVVEWYTKQVFYNKDRLESIIKFVTSRR
jgi:5-methylcytosine-specific restriction endonuclease McrA